MRRGAQQAALQAKMQTAPAGAGAGRHGVRAWPKLSSALLLLLLPQPVPLPLHLPLPLPLPPTQQLDA